MQFSQTALVARFSFKGERNFVGRLVGGGFQNSPVDSFEGGGALQEKRLPVRFTDR